MADENNLPLGNDSLLRAAGYVLGTVLNRAGLREFLSGFEDACPTEPQSTPLERALEIFGQLSPVLTAGLSMLMADKTNDRSQTAVNSAYDMLRHEREAAFHRAGIARDFPGAAQGMRSPFPFPAPPPGPGHVGTVDECPKCNDVGPTGGRPGPVGG